MKEIIAKLQQIGVTATNKQVNNWLSSNQKGLGTLTDADIVTMARDLKPVAAMTKTSSSKPAVQQQEESAAAISGENIYTSIGDVEFEQMGDQDYADDLATIEAMGKRDAITDAELLFGAHQRGYVSEFNRRLQGHKSFRHGIFARAAATVRGA
jgi:hypothetical protein